MTNVISVKNMRESDAFTINTKVCTGRQLMKKAAMGVYENGLWVGNIAIVCGGGNNGGDGYALAEILVEKGINVSLLRVSENFSEDGLYYYKQCLKKGVGDFVCDSFTDFSQYDVIVDCILGTGFSGTLDSDMIDIIREINKTDAYIISVDINSGLNGNNGLANPVAVKSDLTVSIGYLKTGMFLNDACEYIKKLVNCDIGIKLLKKQYYLISGEEAERFMGYGSVCVKSDEFQKQYSLNEREFELYPIKTVIKESQESKKIFVIDYKCNKLIVDQSYVYFCSPRVALSCNNYTNFR